MAHENRSIVRAINAPKWTVPATNLALHVPHFISPHTFLERVGRGTRQRQNSESRCTIQAEGSAEPPGHRATWLLED